MLIGYHVNRLYSYGVGVIVSRVKLLNDGGWYFLDRVNFPVEVEGVVDVEHGLGDVANVTSAELFRVGAEFDWNVDGGDFWSFRIGDECEVLNDEI